MLSRHLAHDFLTEISNQIASDLAAPAAADPDASLSEEERGACGGLPASWDGLRFHEKCGNLVKLSNSRRSAERRRPLDEFNNGVVMTSRPIKDYEIFEVIVATLVCFLIITVKKF